MLQHYFWCSVDRAVAKGNGSCGKAGAKPRNRTDCRHLSKTWAIVSSRQAATVVNFLADSKELCDPGSFCSSGGAAVYLYTGKRAFPPVAPHLLFRTVLTQYLEATRNEPESRPQAHASIQRFLWHLWKTGRTQTFQILSKTFQT